MWQTQLDTRMSLSVSSISCYFCRNKRIFILSYLILFYPILSCQHPVNSTCQHPVNAPCQLTLSTHPENLATSILFYALLVLLKLFYDGLKHNFLISNTIVMYVLVIFQRCVICMSYV